MAIKLKNKFVEENIEDEKGNVLGVLKFNPGDPRIVSKLTKIITDLTDSMEKINKVGELPEIPKEDLEKYEDFEKVAEIFKSYKEKFQIEEDAANSMISDLTEVFGEETINIFTGGTKDMDTLYPLIEYVIPFVNEARKEKVNKYIPKNSEVMD